MEVVVFGAGSLGSLIGGLLSPSHDVTLVGREGHVAAIQERGLGLEGEVTGTVTPAATTDGSALEADVALVTVKSFDTATAAGTLATGTYRAVCSLQNGLGNEAVLAARCSCPVVAGTATHGAVRAEPGVVRCTGLGSVTVGALEPDASEAAALVADVFREATVPVTVAADMERRLWEKLAVNAAINPLTALADVDNGAVCEPPLADTARAVAREVAATADAVGVPLSQAAAIDAVESVAAATASNTSSMRQDVHAGRRTEIDAITGSVIERADDHGVSVPTNRTLAALVRSWEAARDRR